MTPRTYWCVHQLTSADLAAGPTFENEACITAKDKATNPVDVTDASGATKSCDDLIVKIVDSALKITKDVAQTNLAPLASGWANSVFAHATDTVYYRFEVENTGTTNADLTNVTLHDPTTTRPGARTPPLPCARPDRRRSTTRPEWGTDGPEPCHGRKGDIVYFVCANDLTGTQFDASDEFVNWANATGTDSRPSTVTSNDDDAIVKPGRAAGSE